MRQRRCHIQHCLTAPHVTCDAAAVDRDGDRQHPGQPVDAARWQDLQKGDLATAYAS